MATVRTCDRCGASSPVEMNKPSAIRAYAFDAHQPSFPPGLTPGITTVADLCEGCAGHIRRAMTKPTSEAIPTNGEELIERARSIFGDMIITTPPMKLLLDSFDAMADELARLRQRTKMQSEMIKEMGNGF